MAWYDTGTVSVTNGSTTVTGSGTNFVSGAQVGEGFYGPDGRLYEIQAIVSATSLTLADNYLGSTQSGQTYKIVPTQSLVANLASQVSTLISDFQTVADEAGEGKFDDGSAASPGITFTQDQDTGFFRETANEIGISAGGSKIGEFNADGLTVDEVTIAGDLTVDTNTLYVNSTNNQVGIGTASPDTKLTVSAGTGDGIFVEDNNASNTSPFVEVRGKRSDANASQTFAGKLLLDGHRTDAAVGVNKHLGTVAFGGNHTDGSDANILYPASISGVAEGTFSNATTMPTSLVFYAGSTGRSESTPNVTFGSEAMRITSGGNVGIGTTSPVTTLDVAGNARVSNIIYTDGENLTISADANNSAAGSSVDILVDGSEVADFTHSGYLRFNKANYPIGGVCTQSLDSVLSLAGGSNATNSGLNIALSGPDHTASTRGFLMRDGTATVYNYQRSVDAHLWYTGGSERMRVTTGGNVGIGTSSPSALLDVAGDAEINDLTVGRGAGDISTNTALGYQALNSNTTGNSNAAFGRQALGANTTGINNAALGYQALGANTTGNSNVAVGYLALKNNTTGSNNIAFGPGALLSNTTTNNNSALGYQALNSNTTGASNTALGLQALQSNTTGVNNTAFGVQTGDNVTTGSRNTLLGNSCDPSAAGGNDQVVVGFNLTGKGDDTAFIGGTGGAYNEKNVTTWETTSDQRIKKNIADNNDGLSVISQVRVRNFEYRAPDEITELPGHAAIEQDGTQIGVIAQELQQVLPECVSENSTGVLSVNTDPLVWYLINAVKELKAEIEELKGN